MKPLHEELKEIRLEKNITLEQIHEATKIHLEFLRKIEDGDFSIVPKPFLRAFLREYAEVVGIDPVCVIRRYENKTDSIRPHKPIEQMPAVPESGDAAAVETESGELSQKTPEVAPEEIVSIGPETQPDNAELETGGTAGKEEPALPVESEQEIQPSLFEQAPPTEDSGLSAVSDSPQPPAEPSQLPAGEAPGKITLPGERQRLIIEEPGQTNGIYIVGFVIIIFIAAAIIFYINKGF